MTGVAAKSTVKMAWWKEGVVYEIFVRSFKDSNRDGIGDLEGIRQKLPYLKKLGVDILWLTPIFPSPWADAGYDVSDYDAIDPQFGSLEDFDRLLSEAHELGLRLILDLVINHTSVEHPWFREARKSKDNPYRDFYLWRPGKDGREPSNWASLVGGSAWRFDEMTGEYFFHSFSRHQPDLNWNNPRVKDEIFSMMRRWLDRGVDGFRLDVINILFKRPGFPDVPVPEGHPPGAPVLDRSVFADNPGMHELLQAMRQEVLAGRDVMTVGEIHFVTKEETARFIDAARGELDMAVQTDLLFDREDIPHLKRAVSAWYEAARPGGWNTMALGNHDTPRLLSTRGQEGTFRKDAAKCLGTFILTAPGTPFLFQGDELGMANAAFASITDHRDIETMRFYAERLGKGDTPEEALLFMRPRSRDNARTPMPWTAGLHAGFTIGSPWIGLAPDFPLFNVEDEEEDPDSVLEYYRRLLALRKGSPDLIGGAYEPWGDEDSPVYGYFRRGTESSYFILLNWQGAPAALRHPLPTGELLLSNHPGPYETQGLRPWEARLYRLTR